VFFWAWIPFLWTGLASRDEEVKVVALPENVRDESVMLTFEISW